MKNTTEPFLITSYPTYPMNNNNNKKEAKEVAQAYNAWLETVDLTKSPHTVKAYEDTMNLYIKFIEEEKKITDNTF